MDAGGLFAGSEPRNEDEAAFIERLRAEALSWSVPGLDLERHTSGFVGVVPFFVMVDVPWSPSSPRPSGWSNLQIAYWTPDDGAPHLEGAWAGGYLLDDHDGNDLDCLTVNGVDATPAQSATWAADWAQRQLARPVVVDKWLRGNVVAARRWRFPDNERVLQDERSWLSPLRRRRPERTDQARP